MSLEPDEAAAVGLAARLWQSAELADAARGALLKLRAGGVDVEPARTLDVEPRLDAAEEALHPCLDAVQAGRAVRFAYRKPSGGDVRPRGRALGRGVLARPVVSGRPRPRPGRAALLPAVPGARRGEPGRAGGHGQGAHRHRPGGLRGGHRAAGVPPARPGPGPSRAGHLAAQDRGPDRAGGARVGLGRRRDRVRRPGVDRRPGRPAGQRRGRGRAGGGARGGGPAAARACLAPPTLSRPAHRRSGPARPDGAGERPARGLGTGSGERVGGPAAAAAGPAAVPAGPPRRPGRRGGRRLRRSRGRSCAATCSCCGCAGCPGTAPAT